MLIFILRTCGMVLRSGGPSEHGGEILPSTQVRILIYTSSTRTLEEPLIVL